MGDFNCNALSPSTLTNTLTSTMQDFQLTQLISNPTRVSEHSQTLIDHCYASSPQSFSTTDVVPLTCSDHLMIFVCKKVKDKPTTPKAKLIPSFKKCNFEDLSLEMEHAPWGVMDMFDTIDEKWDYWKSLFTKIIDSHAPMIRVRPKQNSFQWIPDATRALMKCRNYYMKKFRKTRDPIDWEHMRTYKKAVRNSLKKGKRDHFTEICNVYGKQPRKVWTELNKAFGRKQKLRISHIETKNHITTASPKQIASELNTHFATADHSEHTTQSPSFHPAKSTFHSKLFSEDEVLHVLKTLNTRKATRADGIPPHLLRTLAPVIANSITKLFNKSLETGEIPKEWKSANITPIPKKTNDITVTNFRPISVLPVIAKAFESLVHKQLYSYLTANTILHSNQSGFRPHHSTQDVILKTVDDWRIALDRGKHVGTVLIDLSKAFDSIHHGLLLSKLELYGLQTTCRADNRESQSVNAIQTGLKSQEEFSRLNTWAATLFVVCK